MATQFTGAYQNIYAAGLARQREEEARRRALLGNAAARSGVSPQTGGAEDEVTRQSALLASDLEGRVAGQQNEERLQEIQFQRQKELMDKQASLQELAAARERAAMRKQQRAGIYTQLIGAGIGAATGGLGYLVTAAAAAKAAKAARDNPWR